MQTITRTRFIEAVETGIAAADFPPAINDALRDVAANAPRFMLGSFGGCGCPATQAGLFPTHAYHARWGRQFDNTPLNERSRFAAAFDSALIDLDPDVIEVTTSIGRKQLEDVVEGALAEAPGLEPFQKAALRAFARTTKAFSSDFFGPNGCPAWQAGLYAPGDFATPGPLRDFIKAFDRQIIGVFLSMTTKIEVID